MSTTQAQGQAPPHHIQVHTATHPYETGVTPGRYEGGVGVGGVGGVGVGFNSGLYPEKGPSSSQILAVVLGLPVGGTLLVLAGLTLGGTLTGLAITTPLFLLFSPVLVPATIVIGLAVAGVLTSGACGLTALSSFSWVLNYMKQTTARVPVGMEGVKQRVADAAGYLGQKTKEVGQKTKEVGQDIQSKAQETKRTST